MAEGSPLLKQEPGGAQGSFNFRVQETALSRQSLGNKEEEEDGARIKASSSFSIFSVCLFSDPVLRSAM